MSAIDSVRKPVLHLVSYSYPPDNTPAAHRPYQLACHLESESREFRAYTRYGVLSTASCPAVAPVGGASGGVSATGKGAARRVISLMSWLLDIDKALPWGLRVMPRLWLDLVRRALSSRQRQDVWATCPGTTNLYLAVMASLLSFSRLHIDLRDAINGINGRRMPLLTRIALRYASSVSVVTDSLQRFARDRAPYLKPVVIYNGISGDAALAANDAWRPRGDSWIGVAYVGALYGGQRPYPRALEMLREAAEMLPPELQGLELRFVGREDVSDLPVRFGSSRLRIVPRGEVSKAEALAISAGSDVNLVLVGSSEEHRCGIPLKVYDSLGVGRPILYVGPMDSDAAFFLERYAADTSLLMDSEAVTCDAGTLASWLVRSAAAHSMPRHEPSSASNSGMIVSLIADHGGRV